MINLLDYRLGMKSPPTNSRCVRIWYRISYPTPQLLIPSSPPARRFHKVKLSYAASRYCAIVYPAFSQWFLVAPLLWRMSSLERSQSTLLFSFRSQPLPSIHSFVPAFHTVIRRIRLVNNSKFLELFCFLCTVNCNP